MDYDKSKIERKGLHMKMGKRIGAVLAAVMMMGTMAFPAMAATQKITSVSLTVSAEVVVGGGVGDQMVEITTKSEKYTVGEYEMLNDGFEWYEEDIPKLELRLYAEDGYIFSLANTSAITLKGANLVKSSKEDSSKTLVIVMTLPPLSEQTQTIETADWSGLTVASWSVSAGAGSYEVKLIRDGSSVGTSKITSDTSYNFADAMTKEGSYSYRVRPINKLKPENKGEWTDSADRYIDAASAQAIREDGAGGKWLQDAAGWWYQNQDGSYTMNNWQQINGKWYYFNEKGYMATGWINVNGKEYYCDAVGGDMLANGTTPDGHTVGADGAKIQ